MHKQKLPNEYEVSVKRVVRPTRLTAAGVLAITVSLLAMPSAAGGHGYDKPFKGKRDISPILFSDIATNADTGIEYRRKASPRDEILAAFKQPGARLGFSDVPFTPGNSRGNPGVAIFDHDNDGDLDLYVTNGPGRGNSLYSSQFAQSGELTFIDVAETAGVDASDQDSAGVCFADIDNDGDQDLYVLGTSEPNQLFENQGDGHFSDITGLSGTGGGERNALGCSFGDVNGDGLLDLVVGNLYNSFENRLALMVPGFEHLKEANQLYINTGDNVFEDRTAGSGLDTTPEASWAIAMVDYDQDGDVDVIVADDQATRIPASAGGEDFGYLRIFRNDGTGAFTDVTEAAGLDIAGDWMGLSFGDINADGTIDIFATNIGDYLAAAVGPMVGLPTEPNQWSSRWFLGQTDGTFTDPGIGDLGTTPFGWGTSMMDYDNDGDLDILFHGGADMGLLVDSTNPGTLLRNNGHATFEYDAGALGGAQAHSRRNVHGTAVGDLNRDGFVDFVSVSSMDWPEPLPMFPIIPPDQMVGGVFDQSAFVWPTFRPDDENPAAGFVWNGWEPVDGGLSVEVNSASNGNRSVSVSLLGTGSMIKGGRSNRDGIGAVLTFTPRARGKSASVTVPVVSGGSHASSNALEQVFGMGRAKKGVLEVLWPGGVKNRLYGVRAGEHVQMPEIPCSYDDRSMKHRAYAKCVRRALNELGELELITHRDRKRLWSSAMIAYWRERGRH